MKDRLKRLHKDVSAHTLYTIGRMTLDCYCRRVSDDVFEKHSIMLFKKYISFRTQRHFRSLRKAIAYAECVRRGLPPDKLEFLEKVGVYL